MPKFKGLYRAKIRKWGIGKAESSSTLLFWLTFKPFAQVPDRDNPSNDQPLDERDQEDRTIRRPLTPKGLQWLANDLKILGFDDTNLKRLDPRSKDAFDFQGKEFLAYCGEKEYQGKPLEDWKIDHGRKEPERPSDEVIDASLTVLGEQYKEALALKSGKSGDSPF